MAKINVYLPDELAARVKEASIPVSRICQAALADAVAASQDNLVGDYASLPDAAADVPLNSHVSLLLRNAYEAAAARGSAEVESGDLLAGLLDESESLTLTVLERLGFSRDAIAGSLASLLPVRRTRTHGTPPLSVDARAILDQAVQEAKRQGTTLVTGAQVLLAFLNDPGTAGQCLRSLGVHEVVNPQVVTVLSTGVAYGRATSTRTTDRDRTQSVAELAERLERLESLVGAALSQQ